MKRNKGFTLIEILVVIVIIGITISFALLSYGDFGASRKILVVADQLANNLKLAQQQSQLEGSVWGLKLNAKEYQLVKFRPPKDWISPDNKSLFKPHLFPNGTYLEIKPTPSSLDKTRPDILIYPSGDMTAATIQLGQNKDTILVSLTISTNGVVTISRAGDHDSKIK